MQVTIQFDSTYPNEVRDAYDMILPLAMKHSDGGVLKLIVSQTEPLTDEELKNNSKGLKKA
jgi:hypothetical protein